MARSALAAVAVMVMALAAFLGITGSALAAPVSGTGVHGSNTGTAVAAARLRPAPVQINDEPCKIYTGSPVCESTDFFLYVYSTNTGDTAACRFKWKMYWGDGKTEIVDRPGADGTDLILKALHIYDEPRRTTIYKVRWAAESVTGGCTIGSGSNEFILDVPRR